MSIKIDCKGLTQELKKCEAVLTSLGGKESAKAIASAINKSLAEGRKEAASLSRKAYTAPYKKLFDSVTIKRASGQNFAGALEIDSRRGASLIHFQAIPDIPNDDPPFSPQGGRRIRNAAKLQTAAQHGISVQPLKGGPRKFAKGKNGGSKSFIMRKKQGGYGIFVRHKRKKNAYEMLFGPSPIQALQREASQEAISEKIEAAFPPVLASMIDSELQKAAK